MQLRQKTILLAASVLALPFVELLLSARAVNFRYRLAFVLFGIAAVSLAGMRVFNRSFNDLDLIRRAVDETASSSPERAIEVRRSDELGAIAQAVRVLRERLMVMSELLVRSSRIESLNILGSILVHDMKNISFRLQSLAQNLEANYDDPQFRESLARTLGDTTQQMNQMVKRFREQKDTVIVKLRINLNEVVRSAMTNVRRDVKGLRVTEEYADLPSVWADALLVENALGNILDNACDAMPWGGHLAVRTHLIENNGGGPAQALIEIADSGTGMSQEFIENELFAPFVTTKQRGLGLGLYTCRQIIRMHGGNIRVYSELGRGTVFSVYLPITD